MVKIRLARHGALKRPFYRIVVIDGRRRRNGRCIEQLGYFNPIACGGETRLQLDLERAEHWLSQGAQISDRAAALMRERRTA